MVASGEGREMVLGLEIIQTSQLLRLPESDSLSGNKPALQKKKEKMLWLF